MKRARYSSAGEFSQSVQTASSTSVNDGRAVLESGSLNKSPLKMSTASLGEATKGMFRVVYHTQLVCYIRTASIMFLLAGLV